MEGFECEKFEKHRDLVEEQRKPLKLEDFSSFNIIWEILNVKDSRNIKIWSENHENF